MDLSISCHPNLNQNALSCKGIYEIGEIMKSGSTCMEIQMLDSLSDIATFRKCQCLFLKLKVIIKVYCHDCRFHFAMIKNNS